MIPCVEKKKLNPYNASGHYPGLNSMKYFLMSVLMTTSLSILLSCNATTESGELEWRDGWVRAMPPRSAMTAAYGELRNRSSVTLELTAFDSSAFAAASLHQSMVEDGVSRMREQTHVQIAPGEVLTLEPGGMHLMLMRANREISAGDEIEIGVSIGDKRFSFELPVVAR